MFGAGVGLDLPPHVVKYDSINRPSHEEQNAQPHFILHLNWGEGHNRLFILDRDF